VVIQIIELSYNENHIKEIINGKIYYMMPGTSSHVRVISRLLVEIAQYLKSIDSDCEVASEGLKVYLNGADSENYVVPDLVVVCDMTKYSIRGYEGVPILIVEVLSPATAKKDKDEKLLEYQNAGVKEYWIVSIGDKCIEQRVLIDGVYKLVNISFILNDILYEIELTDEVKERYSKITSNVFSDLTIDLKEIFKKLIN